MDRNASRTSLRSIFSTKRQRSKKRKTSEDHSAITGDACDGSDERHTNTSSSAASSCSESHKQKTISSDVDVVSAKTRATSYSSLSSDERKACGIGRLTIDDDSYCSDDEAAILAVGGDGEKLDARALSKMKYFAAPPERSIIKKYLLPSFHQRATQFRKLFHAHVPEDEKLLASFSCAYQREILAQGRLYISTRHFCFHANILGWATLFAVPIAHVNEITKERAALIFPNSLQLMTATDRFFFASFVNREKTFRVMEAVWRRIREGGEMTPEELWEHMNPAVDDDEKPPGSATQKRWKRLSKNPSVEDEAMHKIGSSPLLDHSECAGGNGSTEKIALTEPDCDISQSSMEAGGSGESSSTTSSAGVLPPPVSCGCAAHSGRLLLDATYARAPSELFGLLFDDSPWFQQLSHTLRRTVHSRIADNVTGYIASPWATDKEGIKRRTVTYTMALNHTMAPKSCVVTEKQVHTSLSSASDGFVVTKETHNAGVPYADSFVVQCTYCVTLILSNSNGRRERHARLRVHGGIVYKKSIWSVIKSYIEKSTTTGLDEHYAALEAALAQECGRERGGGDGSHAERHALDTSSEDGETEEGDDIRGTIIRTREDALPHGNGGALPASFSSINFLHRGEPRASVVIVPQTLQLYGIVIVALLTSLLLTQLLLLYRLPTSAPSSDALTQLIERMAATRQEQAASPERDLDALIDAVGRIGEELRRVRDATATRHEL